MTRSFIPARRLALAVVAAAAAAALGLSPVADARSPNSYVVRVLIDDGYVFEGFVGWLRDTHVGDVCVSGARDADLALDRCDGLAGGVADGGVHR